MLQLIKYRLAVVTLLFAAFGGALATIIGIDELRLQYVGLACLITFVINLLVSFLLKQKWEKRYKQRLQVISFAIFVLLITAIAFHVYFFQSNTFRYIGFNKQESYHVKGESFTYLGDSLSRSHPTMEPAEILSKYLGGPQQASSLWKQETITSNVLILLASYGSIVICFSFLVSILVETLALKFPKTALK
jgi:hypothetical protein